MLMLMGKSVSILCMVPITGSQFTDSSFPGSAFSCADNSGST